MARERNLDIRLGIKAGDQTGLDSVDKLDAAIQQAQARVEAFAGAELSVDNAAIQQATLELELYGTQLQVLQRQLTEATLTLGGLEAGSAEYEKQAAQVARLNIEISRYSGLIDQTPAKLEAQAKAQASITAEIERQNRVQEEALRILAEVQDAARVDDLAAEVQEQLDQLRESGDVLAAIGLTPEAIEVASLEVEALAAQLRVLQRDRAQAEAELSQLPKGTAEYEKQLVTVTRLRAEEAKRVQQLEGLAGKIGSVGFDLGGAGGGLASLGTLLGGDIGGQVKQVGDLFREVDNLGRALPDTVKSISALGKTVLDTGELGQTASAAIGLLPVGLQASAAGAISLLAAIAPLAAIGLAVAAAIAAVNTVIAEQQRIQEEAAAAAQAHTDALLRQINRQIEIETLISRGDVSSIEAGAEQALAQREASERLLQAKREELTRLEAQLADAEAEYAALGNAFDPAERNRLRLEGERLRAEIEQNTAEIARITVENLGQANEQWLEYTEALGEAAEEAARLTEIQDATRAIQVRVETERELNRLVEQGNAGALRQRRREIEEEIASLQFLIDTMQARAAVDENAAQLAEQYTSKLKDLQTQQALLTDDIIAAAAAREAERVAIQAQIDSILQTIQLETQAAQLLRDGAVAQIEQRIQAINDERAAIESSLPALRQLALTNEDAARQVEQLEARLRALGQEGEFLASSILPQVQIRERIEGIQAVQQAIADSEAKIIDIRRKSLETLVSLEQKRIDALAQVETNRLAGIQKINDDYIKSEGKAFRDYRQREIEMLRDYQEQRLRILNDTEDAIFAAEQSNDVIALARARDEGLKQLRELDDQSSKQQRQLVEQFERESQARDEAHRERLSQIEVQASEARAKAEENFQREQDSLRQQTQERISAEEAALQQTVTQLQDRYRLEQELVDGIFAGRGDQYIADNETYLEQLQQRHEAELAALDEKAAAEISLTQKMVSQKSQIEQQGLQAFATAAGRVINTLLDGIQRQANQLIQQQQRAVQQSVQQVNGAVNNFFGGSSGSSGGAAPQFRAFANEGIATGPTVALLGEKLPPGYAEGVVKFKLSDGLPASIMNRAEGSAGDSVNINVGDINVGDGVSANEVQTALQNGLRRLGETILNAQLRARQA